MNKKHVNGYYTDPRHEMAELVPLDATIILDAGCGEGRFGGLIKETRHAEVWGIEILPEVASKAKEVLDSVVIGDIENVQLSLPDRYFDCIVCNDILEHLKDPWSALNLFRAKLVRGGCVVASIPNVRFFPTIRDLVIKGNWKYQDCGILDITHLRFFTRRSIEDLFHTTGYTIKKLTGIRPLKNSPVFDVFNLITFSSIHDMKFERYAILAVSNN
jgi:SAM-dependent methyltransferase